MGLLKLFCEVILFPVLFNIQTVHNQVINKKERILIYPTTNNELYNVKSLTHLANCTDEDVCRCYISSDNTLVADCSYLNIELVPRFHRNVTVIHLQGNKLRTFSGEGIPETVTYLDLSGNRVNSFIGFPFKDMKQLEYLYLNNNALQYTKEVFHDNIFHGLTSLKHLNIKQNNIKFALRNLHFPVGLSKLENLETLLLDGVDMTGFEESFESLTSLNTLDLSGKTGVCHLGILRSNFFQNISNLVNLDISGCTIHKIEVGTFRILKSLHTLNISSNECLTFRVLGNVTHDLQYTSIRVLDISRLHCTFGPSTVIHRHDIEHLLNTNLTHLYVESNRMAMLNTGVARTLPRNLKFLSVADNKLSFGLYYVELISELPNIEIVRADHQGSPHNLETGSSDCNDWRAPPPSSELSFSGSSELLDCNRNPLRKLDHNSKILTKFSFPVSLREFYYSHNAMDFEIGSLVFGENNLEILDLSNNLFHSWRGPLTNLRQLKYIDLSHNYCTYMSEYFFSVDNIVKTLLIQNNLLGLVLNKDDNRNIFKNFTNLELLDLSTNHIYALPTLLFKHQYKLQTLNLVKKWISKNRAFFVNFDAYECLFSNGTQVPFSNFDDTLIEITKSCDSYIGIIAVFASVILLSISLTISGIVYRYRWKLRYLFYMAKTRYRGYTPVTNAEDDDDFIYDAFISYSSDDCKFVKNDILSNLEDKQGLQLCLHQRDFSPGVEIAENITNAIHQSRKTVVLLSRNYLDSHWCMFEFNMARMESIYSRGASSILLLVFYEEIPSQRLTSYVIGSDRK
ncbi:toll-like receptor 4 [Pecten maximus]|uniref:toll-like receptor 4 n=1 Tax=Pecten maximus TaxID=6579 RepID=UPI0014582304|nr:toll-like receptor 4 [Pecten maximus]